MSSFEKREEDFEKKFAHDEEMRFRAVARRNKLIGLWAGEKLGLVGTSAQAYANEIVAAFINSPPDALFKKLRKDFDEHGVAQSDHQITRNMEELMARAVEEIKAGR
jgi:hypothetical protein